MSIDFAAGIVSHLDGEALISTVGTPSVNTHNGTAAALLDLLGLPAGDGFGECAAEDFLGRVLLAQALLDATGVDEHGRPSRTDGRWTTGGRAPGRLAALLAELHEVATWAVEHHAVVVWS